MEATMMKILIVEDDYVSRRLLQEILAAYGECEAVTDGHSALQAFSHALKGGAHFGLVFLDIGIPGMNGQETLKALRELEEKNGIHGRRAARVVMTTGREDSKSILGAFRVGCDAYIVKPTTRAKIKAQLDKLEIRPQGEALTAAPENAAKEEAKP
jgi:two-component system chemotaxis response regulator CheY